MAGEPKSVTVPWVAAAPERGDRLVMVTAYDFPQGRTADAAGVDIILVGDSLAMVVLGHPDTLSVTMDEMIHHTKAVRRGVKRSLLVADMPYGSFHLGIRPRGGQRHPLRQGGGSAGGQDRGAPPRDGGRPHPRRGAGDGPPGAHPAVGPPPGRLQGPGAGGLGAPTSSRPPRRRRRRAPSRSSSSACRRTSPPRSPGGSRSPPSASAPGPAAPARCSSTTISWGWRSGSRPASCGATPVGKLSREAIARYADDVRAGRFPSPEEGYGGGAPRPADEPAKLYG